MAKGIELQSIEQGIIPLGSMLKTATRIISTRPILARKNEGSPGERRIMQSDYDLLRGLVQTFTACPSCQSDKWKSAKIVVLEGTTKIQGEISGSGTDPGTFSGSARAFWLSDRWFSWDNPIDLNVDLNATTGLVDEVRRLMLSYSDLLKPPPVPLQPPKIGFFGRIPPVPPKQPAIREFSPPERPTLPAPPVRRTFRQHLEGLRTAFVSSVIMTGVMVGVSAIWFDISLLRVIVAAGGILVVFVLAHFKGPKASYQQALKKYEKDQEQYQNSPRELARHKQYVRNKEQKYQTALQEYDEALDQFNKRQLEQKDAVARYEEELVSYERKKERVMKMRELIWRRARICMRCGDGYLGDLTA